MISLFYLFFLYPPICRSNFFIIIQQRVNLDQVKKHVFCTYLLLFNKYPIHWGHKHWFKLNPQNSSYIDYTEKWSIIMRKVYRNKPDAILASLTIMQWVKDKQLQFWNSLQTSISICLLNSNLINQKRGWFESTFLDSMD